MLAKHKASVLEKILTNLSPNDGSLWRATKRTCKLSSQIIPIKKSDGSFVCTDLDKAELFKDYLYETFQPHPDIFSLENNIAVAESLNSPLPVSRPVKYFSPSEVKFVIDKYPHKKFPGFNLITGEVARCLPKKAIIHLTHIFNCILRFSYFPILWKFSTIIMIPKPKKPPDSVSSFRPISLLPFFAKILEKLILKRILPSISNSVLPDAQFGFRSAHSTIHQVHRIVDAISFSLEKKQYCTCAILDVSQAFDRVWHDGFLFKLKKILHPVFYLIIKSYLSNRHFQIRFVADYADDKAIISINSNPEMASHNLQNHLTLMENWYTKWRFKINQSKSIHTTFTLRLSPCPEVSIYGTQIPTSSTVKYLGLTLDRRLTWAPHLRSKRQNLNLWLRLLKTFCNNNKYTHIKTKLLIYKSLIKPIWTYGIQLWGNAKISNINKIQTFQNITLRKLLNAPPYVSNLSIQQDLRMNSVKDEAKLYYKRFHSGY
ncbi:hypothetical protein QTP88_026125 [Uroleucon formosanum]